jgi:hypothetical protein
MEEPLSEKNIIVTLKMLNSQCAKVAKGVHLFNLAKNLSHA